MTSSRILEEDACHRARNLCVFSRVQKGTPRLTHKGCILQHVSLGALSDVMVVLMVVLTIELSKDHLKHQNVSTTTLMKPV